ncbi:MAG: sulfotransferase domain-containing protein [Gammaproteobacteria bacterium]|nr:sulfotransferase domain-containing protein [Gammaproteobacteria bacterium]
MTAPEGDCPGLLIAGAQRCGTSYLHEFLAHHPSLLAPRFVKELHFFDRRFSRGWDWYRRQWPDRADGRLRFETSPEYMFDPLARLRIIRHLPETKILLCLRCPVARLESAYRRYIRNTGKRISGEEFLERDPTAVSRGLYSVQVEPLLNAFGGNLRVLIYERDLEEASLKHHLSRFLGVDEEGFSSAVIGHRNVGTQRRFPAVYGFLVGVRKRLLRSDADRVVSALDHLRPGRLFPPQSGEGPALGTELKRELTEVYAPDRERLESLLGQFLKDLWHV